MNVYVTTTETVNEGSIVTGVYSTLELAQDTIPGANWERDANQEDTWYVQTVFVGYHQIQEWTVY